MRVVVLGLMVMAGQGDKVSPQDIWPQWRGPSGDNVAPSAALPTRWSKTENVVWKAALPGWGNSTPAIWKDAIFVTTQVKDEDLLLLRLDGKTGKVVWEKKVGKGTPRRKGKTGNDRFHDENNMASPSPVTDGQHVWVHFGNGDFACFDFAGEKAWSMNLPEKYGKYTIWWGHSNSPLLVGDLLISLCIQDPLDGGKSYIVAHDKRTGKEKWLVPRGTGATKESGDSYVSPLLYRHQGQDQVVVFGGNVLDAYDPATGKQLWTFKGFKGDRVISSPTLAGDTIYAVEGMKGPVFAIKADGSGDVTASHSRWTYKATKLTPDAASPVIANGFLFLANNDGLATCVDTANGKELWKERLADGFRATPLVSGNRIYFIGKDGKTTVVEAAREYKMVAQCELDEPVWASPAAVGDDLFIRTKLHLYRIGNGKAAGR